jgi:hypothetical protein
MATEPLSKALNTNLGGTAYKQFMSSQKPILEQKEKLSTELAGTEQKILEGQQLQKETEAQGKVDVGEQYVQQRGEAQQMMQEKLAQKPIEPFIPTKDTAQDIAGLFGVISVLGMLGGKGNAQRAMGAMNGMLEGHRKGRADLYKQERDTYDKNFKALLKEHEQIRAEFKDALETMAVDKELGIQKAQLAAVKSGSSILQEYVRKGEIVKAIQLTEEMGKTISKATELDQRERQHGQTIAAANERSRLDREAREATAKANREAADARALLRADASQKGNALKPGAKVTEAYIADNQLKTDIQDITNDLKTNPSLVQKLQKYRIEAFLTEEGKVLNQVVNEDIPSDLRQFLTKVRDVRNNYYLNISGKAVTGGEALRSYGTVPQPGDSAEGMVDKLNGMSKRVTQAISIKQQLYGLPSLNLSAGGQTMLTPNESYPVFDQSSGSNEKIATPEDVEFTARENNLTYEQTVQKLKERGYRIQGMKLDSSEGEY